MTGKIPFSEVHSAGAITLMVVQGNVPSAREEAQLLQIIRLCSLMTDCWALDQRERPNIAQCCNEIKWMVSSRAGFNPKIPNATLFSSHQYPLWAESLRIPKFYPAGFC